MQKVTFSCSRCSTKIESSGDSPNVDYDCPTCGKSLRLRNSPADETCPRNAGKRIGLGAAIALLAVLVISIALAFLVKKGPAARHGEGEGTVSENFDFLQWSRTSWEDRLGHEPWRIVGHDPQESGGVIATSESGANVAVAFRGDGRPGNITIVSRTGQDDLKNCFRAAYEIDPTLARQFAKMLRVDPAVMDVDRRYQLGNSPYAMGAANGNSLWLEYVGALPEDQTIRKLDSAEAETGYP